MQSKSLKEVLLNAINEVTRLSLKDVEEIAHRQGRKVSYAERELRHLMEVGVVVSEKN